MSGHCYPWNQIRQPISAIGEKCVNVSSAGWGCRSATYPCPVRSVGLSVELGLWCWNQQGALPSRTLLVDMAMSFVLQFGTIWDQQVVVYELFIYYSCSSSSLIHHFHSGLKVISSELWRYIMFKISRLYCYLIERIETTEENRFIEQTLIPVLIPCWRLSFHTTAPNTNGGAAGYASRAPPQYEDCLSRYGNFHYKDTTAMRQSDPYKWNSFTGKTASLYWDGPRFHWGTSLWWPSWYIRFTQNKWNSCRVKAVTCPIVSCRDSHDKNPKCYELAK